jgi:serine/threonine protein kinase
MTEDAPARFTRGPQVNKAYATYVCYVAHEPSTAVQVFWYEFLIEMLTPAQEAFYFRQLCDAQAIQSRSLLRILSVSVAAAPARFVVVTEGMQAPHLGEYLQSIRNPLPLRTCLRWFRSLCEAVRALHEAGIVHGAVSLQTAFIVQRTGTVKLKMPLAALSGRNALPCAIDIDQYTAPEALARVQTPASDIWALAVVLLELVTVTTAYAECTDAQQRVEALRALRPPAALAAVQNRQVAEFLELCFAAAEARPTIDDVLRHPIYADDGAVAPNAAQE